MPHKSPGARLCYHYSLCQVVNHYRPSTSPLTLTSQPLLTPSTQILAYVTTPGRSYLSLEGVTQCRCAAVRSFSPTMYADCSYSPPLEGAVALQEDAASPAFWLYCPVLIDLEELIFFKSVISV